MKYYLLGSNGLFFVLAAGFTASSQAEASQVSEEQATCLAGLGFEFDSEEVRAVKSFGVNYIRKGDVQADHSIAANKLNPSKRRFATIDDAIQHGSRFRARRLRAGDAPGTANHMGFYVTETNDPVNATVNPKTGLTNSL